MKKLAAVSSVLVLLCLGLVQTAAAAPKGPGATLTMLLQLRHPKGLERFVRSVSDPASPSYGEYATVAELVERFGAAPADRKAAMRWLAAHRAEGKVGPTGNYIVARFPARVARLALPAATGASASAAGVGERVVPPALRGVVTSIGLIGTEPGAFGTNTELTPANVGTALGLKGTSVLPNTGTPEGCKAGIAAGDPAPLNGFTPNEYLDAYGHSRLHQRGFQGQGKTVALIEIDGFRKSDVATFAKCFGVKTPNIRTLPVAIKKPLPPGPETTLDLEVLSVAAPKLKRIDVYEGGSSEVGILLSVAASLSAAGQEPDAISISLGGCEPGLIGQIAFRDALDEVFAVAGGAGISVLVAAGDQGSSACKVEVKGEESTALPLLSASDPASSGWVTAVGGTNLGLTKGNQIKNEIVWNDAPIAFGGGGGAFSILTTPRPWWQKGVPGPGNGRIVPDVAGLADIAPGYAIYCTAEECRDEEHPEGGWSTVGGTSAATPLYAGGVLVADGYLESRGAPPLGFLNPLVYSIGRGAGNGGGQGPGVLRDVTKGDNDLGVLTAKDAGGGKPLGCCSAKKGYDAASGWGSLDFPALAQVGLRKLGG